jgi:hypothetical protein
MLGDAVDIVAKTIPPKQRNQFTRWMNEVKALMVKTE